MLLLSFWPLSPKQSVQGTGLAFIAFTEAMTHFPASPFWSVMFFLMLINLGLGSMIGTMSGITTPIIDTFKVRKEVFTGEVFCILLGKGGRSPVLWGSFQKNVVVVEVYWVLLTEGMDHLVPQGKALLPLWVLC